MKIKTELDIFNLTMERSHGLDFPKDYVKGYTQAQSDLLESASESFDEWFDSQNILYPNIPRDSWQACSLHHAKHLKEKDERIKELEDKLELSRREKLIAINSLNELNRHLSNKEHVDSSWIKDVIEVQSSSYVETLKERKKYQEAVKDIDNLSNTLIEAFSNVKTERCCIGYECACLGKPTNPEYYWRKLGEEIKSKYGLDKQERES